jgi:hypothetical protein
MCTRTTNSPAQEAGVPEIEAVFVVEEPLMDCTLIEE